jgi:hypothetical protein
MCTQNDDFFYFFTSIIVIIILYCFIRNNVFNGFFLFFLVNKKAKIFNANGNVLVKKTHIMSRNQFKEKNMLFIKNWYVWQWENKKEN